MENDETNKQILESQLPEHKMATLKEIFDLCKVLELFSSLLKPEVTDEDEQIPLEALEMDLQI